MNSDSSNTVPEENAVTKNDATENTDWISNALPPMQTAPTQQTTPINSAPIPSPIPAPGAPHLPAQQEGDGTGGIIPYKNPKALLAYYIGLFSLVPVAGLVMAPAAIWLGIQGLKYAKEFPVVKGQVHAWIGIVCGVIWTIFNYGLLFLIGGAFLFGRS